MSFQVTLRAARVNRGMKQADAARSIGVSSRTIYNWEIGKRYPPADKLLSLCDLYGVPMDNIFIPRK